MRFETAARRLQDTAFLPSTVLNLPLPKEGVYRSLNFRFHGAIQTTFSSGSPVAPAIGTIDTLCSSIQVVVNGRIVKSVRPHMIHLVEILAYNQEGKRTSNAGAAAQLADVCTTTGTFAFGTTTQYSTVDESIQIPFEMVLARHGQEKTWLNLNGVSSANVYFNTLPYSGLDTSGATITYANATFIFEAYLEEIVGVVLTPGKPLADFQQIWNQLTVVAQSTDVQFPLVTGNFLAGILIYQEDADLAASDLGLTTLKIMTGNKIIKQVDFKAEQSKMRQDFKSNCPLVSGLSRLDGVCYISLLSNKRDLNSAFDARNLNALNLVYSTDNSTNAEYNLTLNIEQHVIVTGGQSV